MEHTFDNTHIINKGRCDKFTTKASAPAVAAYTISVSIWLELYKAWICQRHCHGGDPEATFGHIKEFDKTWSLARYE